MFRVLESAETHTHTHTHTYTHTHIRTVLVMVVVVIITVVVATSETRSPNGRIIHTEVFLKIHREREGAIKPSTYVPPTSGVLHGAPCII